MDVHSGTAFVFICTLLLYKMCMRVVPRSELKNLRPCLCECVGANTLAVCLQFSFNKASQDKGRKPGNTLRLQKFVMIHIRGVGKNHIYIYIYGVHSVFLAVKIPNTWSYTVNLSSGSGQTYTSGHTMPGGDRPYRFCPRAVSALHSCKRQPPTQHMHTCIVNTDPPPNFVIT